MEKWLKKAQSYVKQSEIYEAVLICKACIEEYSSWCDKQGDVNEYVDVNYKEEPFNILEKVISITGEYNKELSEFCQNELAKKKYKSAYMFDSLNDLYSKLSLHSDGDDFIALQDKMLQNIENKASWDAHKIFERKIEFYKRKGQPDKAWNIVKENIQIEDYRKDVVEKLIAGNKLEEAKKLISDFLFGKNGHVNDFWNEKLLEIAQKENDIHIVREITFHFIERNFDKKHYNIYKSTFNTDEWQKEKDKLIRHYNKEARWFSRDLANLLAEEKEIEKLMDYVAYHHSVDILNNYYKHFAPSYPEKTLEMFRKEIDQYAKVNLGREHYSKIVSLFKEMVKIKCGKEVVKSMIDQYNVIYKNRKAMMEILKSFRM